VDPETVGRLLGLFGTSHLPYADSYDADESEAQRLNPTIVDLTEKAVQV